MLHRLTILVVCCTLAAGCVAPGSALSPATSPLPTATHAPQPLQLALVHSNDSWGYLFACG